MTTRKVLLLIVTFVCVANAWKFPWQKDDKKSEDETIQPEEVQPSEPEIPEEIIPEIPRVEAGVVVSLSKQFLIDEQTNLLNRFVNAINWIGQTATYSGLLGDFVPDT